MARYIDADKVMEEINRIGGHNLCEWETIGVKALIDRQPTADVVPKSEVRRLRGENRAANRVIKNLEHDIEVYQEAFKNIRYEVAREIFEEIEKLFFKNGVFIHIQSYNELKKKYTESENG